MSIAEIRARWAGGIVLEVHLQQAKRDIHTLLVALDTATAERDKWRAAAEEPDPRTGRRLLHQLLRADIAVVEAERDEARARVAELIDARDAYQSEAADLSHKAAGLAEALRRLLEYTSFLEAVVYAADDTDDHEVVAQAKAALKS